MTRAAPSEAVAAKLREMGMEPMVADLLVRDPRHADIVAERRLAGRPALSRIEKPHRRLGRPLSVGPEVLAEITASRVEPGRLRQIAAEHGILIGTLYSIRSRMRPRQVKVGRVAG